MRFMSEAIGGIVAWAGTLGVKSIKAKIDNENTASIRMCESNGFEKVDYNIWKIKL
jgi:RimJ/RimL family protein N-acetyltransferase